MKVSYFNWHGVLDILPVDHPLAFTCMMYPSPNEKTRTHQSKIGREILGVKTLASRVRIAIRNGSDGSGKGLYGAFII